MAGASFARRASSALRSISDFGSTEKVDRSGVRDDESEDDRVVEGEWVAPRAGLRELGVAILNYGGVAVKRMCEDE